MDLVAAVSPRPRKPGAADSAATERKASHRMLEGRQSRTAVIALKIVCADFLLELHRKACQDVERRPWEELDFVISAHEVTTVQNHC